MALNVRSAPDQVLVDIADYVLNYTLQGRQALDAARLSLTDTLACAPSMHWISRTARNC